MTFLFGHGKKKLLDKVSPTPCSRETGRRAYSLDTQTASSGRKRWQHHEPCRIIREMSTRSARTCPRIKILFIQDFVWNLKPPQFSSRTSILFLLHKTVWFLRITRIHLPRSTMNGAIRILPRAVLRHSFFRSTFLPSYQPSQFFHTQPPGGLKAKLTTQQINHILRLREATSTDIDVPPSIKRYWLIDWLSDCLIEFPVAHCGMRWLDCLIACSFESSQLAANFPIEDRCFEARLLRNGGMVFSVIDGHGGPGCGQALSERLADYVSVALMDVESLERLSKEIDASLASNSEVWFFLVFLLWVILQVVLICKGSAKYSKKLQKIFLAPFSQSINQSFEDNSARWIDRSILRLIDWLLFLCYPINLSIFLVFFPVSTNC